MNVEELAKAILDLFEQNKCNTGDILMPQWILAFRTDLNPADNEIFEEAKQRLIGSCFIEIATVQNMETFRLLQAGYDHIYRNV